MCGFYFSRTDLSHDFSEEMVNAAIAVRLTLRRHAAPEHEALRAVADRRHAP